MLHGVAMVLGLVCMPGIVYDYAHIRIMETQQRPCLCALCDLGGDGEKGKKNKNGAAIRMAMAMAMANKTHHARAWFRLGPSI